MSAASRAPRALATAEKRIVAFRIDDVVDAIPVHGACGAWGLIAVGLFEPSGGLFYGHGVWLLGTQIVGIVTIFSLGFWPIYGLCKLLNSYGILRASEEEESMGLDQYLFKVSAYVDHNSFESGETNSFSKLEKKLDKKAHRSSFIHLMEQSGPEMAMPPLLDVITMLKAELEMPKETTMTQVINQACREFEVNLPESVTLQAKAYACWKMALAGNALGGHDSALDAVANKIAVALPPPPAQSASTSAGSTAPADPSFARMASQQGTSTPPNGHSKPTSNRAHSPFSSRFSGRFKGGKSPAAAAAAAAKSGNRAPMPIMQ